MENGWKTIPKFVIFGWNYFHWPVATLDIPRSSIEIQGNAEKFEKWQEILRNPRNSWPEASFAFFGCDTRVFSGALPICLIDRRANRKTREWQWYFAHRNPRVHALGVGFAHRYPWLGSQAALINDPSCLVHSILTPLTVIASYQLSGKVFVRRCLQIDYDRW